MTEPLTIRVRNALADVKNPKTGRSIIADGAIHGLRADPDGNVFFALEAADLDRGDVENLLQASKNTVQQVDGVARVNAVATAHAAAPQLAPQPPKQTPARGGHDNPLGMKKTSNEPILDGVQHVIAVASGKGGVGKSTMAANIAVTLARMGKKVGLLDADIYGPSAPTLFGIKDRAKPTEDGKIAPAQAHGVAVMSIGMMVDPNQALAWRGPMVMGALKQLMRDVDWSGIDILIIDTPPGTGDAHLSLIQTKRITGAIIVSTPQEMALADVRRGVELFRKTNIPIVGVVENMAWLETETGDKTYLFGQGGAKAAAADLGAPFLGEAPIIPGLREASDAGAPFAAGDQTDISIFEKIAAATLEFVER